MSTVEFSIEIIARFFQEHISYQRISSDREPSITRFQIYDSDTFLLQKDCLYLCLDESFPPCYHIEPGTAVISLDDKRTCADRACRRCDLLTVTGMTPTQLINGVSSVFDSYRERFGDLRACALSGGDAGELLSAAADIIGLPCALLDVNLDVIAAQGAPRGFQNPLWQTIDLDRKPTRCEILDRIDIRLAPAFDRPNRVLSATASISGWIMSQSPLYRRARQCAALWVFQDRPGREFSRAELQLIESVRKLVVKWAECTTSIRASRDSKLERWLLDVADGTLGSEEDILRGASAVGYESATSDEHQLMIIRPQAEIQSGRTFEFLSCLEETIPHSIGALADSAVLLLMPTDESGYLPRAKLDTVNEMCARRSCHAVISSSYIRLSDTPRIIAQLTDTLRMVEEEEGFGLYCYHDYLVRQSMG